MIDILPYIRGKLQVELVKNIFFNTDKLTPNSDIKISYTGKFFQDNSSEVYIHYGFGEDWNHSNDIKMEKSELGFQAEIHLLDSNLFNFCFKNQDDAWDNNNQLNYIFPIEKVCTDLILTDNNMFSLSSKRHLRRTYLWSKKIKLAIYKLFLYVPKIISGNYKKRKQTNIS